MQIVRDISLVKKNKGKGKDIYGEENITKLRSRHPFHQDLAYFPFGPTNKIVAAWAAL